MEAVVFTGIQGTGKSTFFRERFFDTHVRINLDMLRTRHRESVLLRACIESLQPFVADNTNPTAAERAKYIAAAGASGFAVVGYYFESKLTDALRRNNERPLAQQVPRVGVLGTHKRLQIPTLGEGYDRLFYVKVSEGGAFVVEDWRP